jgi:hypothetical protein
MPRFIPQPFLCGGATGIRTPDLLRAKQPLSHLSYRPEIKRELSMSQFSTSMVGVGGLEPPTSILSGSRSNLLSYTPQMYCTTPAQSTLLSTHETIRYHAAALLSSRKTGLYGLPVAYCGFGSTETLPLSSITGEGQATKRRQDSVNMPRSATTPPLNAPAAQRTTSGRKTRLTDTGRHATSRACPSVVIGPVAPVETSSHQISPPPSL